jgi:hypothetical protein
MALLIRVTDRTRQAEAERVSLRDTDRVIPTAGGVPALLERYVQVCDTVDRTVYTMALESYQNEVYLDTIMV